MRVDLHMHSSLSDGTDSPREIVDKAKDEGLKYISITDHDCIKAVADASNYARSKGVGFINGVELSTYSLTEIHVLGYCFDADNERLREKLDWFETKRKERAIQILDRLYDLGIKLDRDSLPVDSASVGRLHIAKLMVTEGYAESVPDAFDRYLGANGKAYCPSRRITPMQGAELIKQAHGYPVIAHPMRLLKAGKLRPLIEGLKPLGLAGLEVYYPTHDKATTDELYSLARRYALFATGGTDYHGENRNVKMGSVQFDLDGYTASGLGIKR